MPDEHAEAPASIAEALEQQDKPDEPQETAATEAPDTSGQADEQTSPDAQDTPEYLSDKFDPAELPDEIRNEYLSIRKEWTQKTQALAEQRKEAEQAMALRDALLDPEQAAGVLEALGYELEDDEPDEDPDEYEDNPNAPLEERLEALESFLQQQAQTEEEARLEQAMTNYLGSEVQQLEQQTGRQFTEEELDAIEGLAVVRRNAEGLPDVRGAYELIFSQVLPAEKKRWAESKQAPHVQPSGSPVTEEINDDSSEARVNRILEIAQNNG